ncbi:MAG: dihydrodipicolinate synthase family protein [Eubacteriales bacterium]|nr:dihydrodipicolinate synthase family protein [Eubacteriales bacterium]
MNYSGIYPAFYAAYDSEGKINLSAAKSYAKILADCGVQGLYVGGSSGECIYQSVDERKRYLEGVVEAVGERLEIIAHVACNNTADSVELASHASTLNIKAIAAIPPIYFHLSNTAIAAYWRAIAEAAPNLDFIIYNIPQLAGVSLSPALLETMLEVPSVIGVKNSSMPVLDITEFLELGRKHRSDFIVFNGPDEQLVSGLAAGAAAGIGGTYGAFPELYLAIFAAFEAGDLERARRLQRHANEYIRLLCHYSGNLYAVAKALVRHRYGVDLGSVRAPLTALSPSDESRLNELFTLVDVIIQEEGLDA